MGGPPISPGMPYTLHVGEKRFSSWSARPWILLRGLGIPFTERLVSLQPDRAKARAVRPPAGRPGPGPGGRSGAGLGLARHRRVPGRAPRRGLAGRSGGARLRPLAAAPRCTAASRRCATRCRWTWPRAGRSAGAAAPWSADIARLEALWTEARRRFGRGGPFLFGGFGAADAYFAPVAFRFRTYGVEPGGEAGAGGAGAAGAPVGAGVGRGRGEGAGARRSRPRRDVPGRSGLTPARRPGRPPAPRGASLRRHVLPPRRAAVADVRPPPPAGYRWLVLAACSLAMFGCYYTFDALYPVAPLLEKTFGVTGEQLGLLDTSYNVAALLTLIAGGILIDRIGMAASAILFAAVGAIGTLCIAVLAGALPGHALGRDDGGALPARHRLRALHRGVDHGGGTLVQGEGDLLRAGAPAAGGARWLLGRRSVAGSLQAALRQLAAAAPAGGGAGRRLAGLRRGLRRAGAVGRQPLRGGQRRGDRQAGALGPGPLQPRLLVGGGALRRLLRHHLPVPHLRQPLPHRRPRRLAGAGRRRSSRSCRCSR